MVWFARSKPLLDGVTIKLPHKDPPWKKFDWGLVLKFQDVVVMTLSFSHILLNLLAYSLTVDWQRPEHSLSGYNDSSIVYCHSEGNAECLDNGGSKGFAPRFDRYYHYELWPFQSDIVKWYWDCPTKVLIGKIKLVAHFQWIDFMSLYNLGTSFQNLIYSLSNNLYREALIPEIFHWIRRRRFIRELLVSGTKLHWPWKVDQAQEGVRIQHVLLPPSNPRP